MIKLVGDRTDREPDCLLLVGPNARNVGRSGNSISGLADLYSFGFASCLTR